jgi:cobyrinic acid a,c-diamide synthase
MCGVLDIDAEMTGRLTLGYRDAVAVADSALAGEGAVVAEGFVQGGVHASYLHTHWKGLPGTADRIVAAAYVHRAVRFWP